MNFHHSFLRLGEHYQSQQWLQLLELASDLEQSKLETNPEALFFIATAHRQLGQPELGLDAYQKALLLDPASIGLRLEAASSLQDLEDWSAAQHLLVGVKGDNPEQFNLAEILRLRNSIYLDDACAVERQLLASLISHESHLIAVGIALAEVNIVLERHDVAQQCLTQLFELAPHHPRGLILQLRLISLAWHSGGVHKKIDEVFNRSLGHRLVGIETARVYERFKLLDEARSTYELLIDRFGLAGLLADNYMQYLANYGLLEDLKVAISLCSADVTESSQLLLAQCCLEAGLLDESLDHLKLCPDDDRKVFLQARLANCTANAAEALALLRRLYSKHPGNPNIRFDLSLALLSRADWSAAWPHYEQRFSIVNSSYCVPAGIRPVNSELHPKGRHVLVFGEQGIGDTVMMASVLPDLLDAAASVVLFVQPRLAELFSYSFPGLEVVSAISEDQFLKFDSCYGMGTLPRFFRPSTSSCPGDSYLSVDHVRIDAWKQKLAEFGAGLKVGVAWRGGPAGLSGQRRSMALQRLLPVLELEGVHWFSLQNRHDPLELEQLHDSHDVLVTHFSGIADDIYETAGLIAALDLVITVQQSALHLAGALGQEAWVLLPAKAEWRYGSQGSQMPWYNSVELFRQSALGDWDGPIESVRQRLISWLAEVASQNEGQQLS